MISAWAARHGLETRRPTITKQARKERVKEIRAMLEQNHEVPLQAIQDKFNVSKATASRLLTSAKK